MAEREELRAEITLDDRKFQEGAKRVESRSSRLIKWIAGIGAVVGVGVAAWKLWNRHVAAGDRKMEVLGWRLGINKGLMQKFSDMAKQTGLNVSTLGSTFGHFSLLIDRGIEKNVNWQRALKTVGIESLTSKSKIGKFFEVLQAGAALPGPERKRWTEAVFGKRAGEAFQITGMGPKRMSQAIRGTKEPLRRGAEQELVVLMPLLGKVLARIPLGPGPREITPEARMRGAAARHPALFRETETAPTYLETGFQGMIDAVKEGTGKTVDSIDGLLKYMAGGD